MRCNLSLEPTIVDLCIGIEVGIAIIMFIITIITKIIIGIQVAIAIIIILHPPKPTMYQFVPLPLPSEQLLPSIRTQSVPRSNLQPHVIVVFCREVAVFGNVGQIIIDFANTDPSCREVAVFGKEDNLVTSFTNPGFLFPCSIAFCPERKEAFILDKR